MNAADDNSLIYAFSFLNIWELTVSVSLVSKRMRQLASVLLKHPQKRICISPMPTRPATASNVLSSTSKLRIKLQISSEDELKLQQPSGLPAGVLYYIACGFGKREYSHWALVKQIRAASGSSLQDQVKWSDKIVQEAIAQLQLEQEGKSVSYGTVQTQYDDRFLMPPQNPFRNQMRNGGVRGGRAAMVMYDDHFGKPEAAEILNRYYPTRLFTSGRDCWFMIDFSDQFAIIPSGYALRYHRPVLKRNAAPRNWKLEGGNQPKGEDSIIWETLIVHEDDSTIADQDGACGIWQLSSVGNRSFRYFRIVLMPKQEAREIPFQHTSLYVSGIEFYGTLLLSRNL
jgi:hypothetical protein